MEQGFSVSDSGVCALLRKIVEPAIARPVSDDDTGVTHPASWPPSAVYAVEYKMLDRQFPDVHQQKYVQYFDSLSELLGWIREKKAWVLDTDNDFSCTYSTYVWDWGPVFRSLRSM